jgi:hypothetical protein
MLKPSFAIHNLLLSRSNHRLFVAMVVHIVVCAIALVLEAKFYTEYHIFFDSSRIDNLVLCTVVFALFGLLFLPAEFSVGFLISYHFYVMVGGFLWINYFTDLKYDHSAAAFSAMASGLAFVLPALFLKIELPRPQLSSEILFKALLYGILVIAAVTILFGSIYHLKFTTLGDADDIRLRGDVFLPTIVRYAVGITSCSLLPFAFACFALKKQYVHAALTILLLACFYPITLSKTAFFTPVWLIFAALISRFLESRLASVLFLLVPMSIGLISTLLPVSPYFFWLLDHRMYIVPANALAIYNDFFSRHAPTHFCQINAIRIFFGCSYGELGTIFRDTYQQGNYNASLFATEGIASVGVRLAPLPVFFCSLLIALANAAARHLPKRLVLISSSVLPQIFLNVPFSVTMLSSGAACLFLLWYLSPSEAKWV